MPSRAYLLSLPERVIRSALGFSAGLLREIGELALPRTVRRGQLYKSLVDTTLRYVIEQVGGAKGVYPTEVPQAQDFLARRGVGHAIELLGIAAFRISPVWVFAALADLSGLGRRLIPEIAEALKEEGLLEKEAQFENVDQLLDSLEKTSSRLAQTINAPPIDVACLRKEWTEIRSQARGLKPVDLPSVRPPRECASRRGSDCRRRRSAAPAKTRSPRALLFVHSPYRSTQNRGAGVPRGSIREYRRATVPPGDGCGSN